MFIFWVILFCTYCSNSQWKSSKSLLVAVELYDFFVNCESILMFVFRIQAPVKPALAELKHCINNYWQ